MKEAPQRGWTSSEGLALVGLFLAGGAIFALRSLRAPLPIVNLAALRDRRLAVGCVLSFLIGIGLVRHRCT